MKKLLLLLFLIPNLVMAENKSYICSTTMINNPTNNIYDPNKCLTCNDQSFDVETKILSEKLWRHLEHYQTKYIDIDTTKKKIIVKNIMDRNEHVSEFDLMPSLKNQYKREPYIYGIKRESFDMCGELYRLDGINGDIPEECKYKKNDPNGSISSILFNKYNLTYMSTWQHEEKGKMKIQIEHGRCSLTKN